MTEENGLRPFSEEPYCPKCRGKHFMTSYHLYVVQKEGQETPCELWQRAGLLGDEVPEHLCRVCGLCGYGWPEEVGDA